MNAFDVLGDPVRRRILELLGDGRESGDDIAAGDIVEVIRAEFGISQPAVSRHLRVLRDSGFVTSTTAGQRRLYAIDDAPLREIDRWLGRYRAFWSTRLDALDTEVRRGTRESPPRSTR
jgi:DNA-binding transcriptional ArsR family regulator